jgi:hypothetical protein
MDKQNLIAIAKDQLKGGIAQEQVRELLTYRGVGESEVNEIMQAVLADESARPVQLEGKDIVEKTHTAFQAVSQDAEINPDAARKERIIILGSVIGAIIFAIAGSVIYFLYF